MRATPKVSVTKRHADVRARVDFFLEMSPKKCDSTVPATLSTNGVVYAIFYYKTQKREPKSLGTRSKGGTVARQHIGDIRFHVTLRENNVLVNSSIVYGSVCMIRINYGGISGNLSGSFIKLILYNQNG